MITGYGNDLINAMGETALIQMFSNLLLRDFQLIILLWSIVLIHQQYDLMRFYNGDTLLGMEGIVRN